MLSVLAIDGVAYRIAAGLCKMKERCALHLLARDLRPYVGPLWPGSQVKCLQTMTDVRTLQRDACDYASSDHCRKAFLHGLMRHPDLHVYLTVSILVMVEEEDDADFVRRIVMEAVTRCGIALQYASEAMRDDRDVVLAVRHHGWALEFASPRLRGDRDVVLTAVRNDGSALQDASGDLQCDKEVVLAAVKQGRTALQFASGEIRRNFIVFLYLVYSSITRNPSLL